MLAEIVALERDGAPEPLLDGDEIGPRLEISGPAIGKAVTELDAAQFAGEVADRDGAIAHLRAWAEER